MTIPLQPPRSHLGVMSVAWNDLREMLDPLDPAGVPGRTVWRSTLYQVIRNELRDGSLWLSIKRTDRSHVRDWRHLQEIKNQLAGPEREAVELFPAESRKVDTSDQFHLWVLPEGMVLGYGYAFREVAGPEAALPGGSQRAWEDEIRPDDLTVPEPDTTPNTIVLPEPVWQEEALRRDRELRRRRGRR